MVELHTITPFLSYSPDTGLFRWLKSPNRRIAVGCVAGRTNKHGYVEIGIHKRILSAHRLAWLLSHGEWPDGDIDHVNGDRQDNRLSNLRVVSRRENVHNIHGAMVTNRLGVLGVVQVGSRYRASIRHEGRTVSLGNYSKIEDAQKVYAAVKSALHPTFSNDTDSTLRGNHGGEGA
ncbi:hypothetical protein C1I89_10235 [Achromobacter pulmonis]|uniref:HNH nuclease domain-containing protein n=1 Tax=Achromobacter pulmonis TaxID=1389932 RepID=A0A2N8KM77_9BURK|nr:hypothetical protein C1I89_10235 [Achromobacter pulmonis]